MEDKLQMECGNGWEELVEPIIQRIKEKNKDIENEEDKVHILQIKEKFGGLRFYIDRYDDEEMFDMIRHAEAESYRTCEICGSKENVFTVNHRGWYSTKCLGCIKNLLNDKNSHWKKEDLILFEPKSKKIYTLNDKFELCLKTKTNTKE